MNKMFMLSAFLMALINTVRGQDETYTDYTTPDAPVDQGTLGQGMSVFLPSWFLLIIFFAFMSGMAYIVMNILNAENQRGQKRVTKKDKKRSTKKDM